MKKISDETWNKLEKISLKQIKRLYEILDVGEPIPLNFPRKKGSIDKDEWIDILAVVKPEKKILKALEKLKT